jgi:hypothetical protein
MRLDKRHKQTNSRSLTHHELAPLQLLTEDAWFYTDLAGPGHAVADGSLGRPAVFSDAAIQCFLTINVLLTLTMRHTTGIVTSLLQLANLGRAVTTG